MGSKTSSACALPICVALAALALPAQSFAVDTVRALPDRIELHGDPAGNHFLVGESATGRITINSPIGNTIEAQVPANGDHTEYCRNPRIAGDDTPQQNRLSCPRRAELAMFLGGGNDAVRVRPDFGVDTEIDGEGGSDVILASRSAASTDRCTGGSETPPLPDTIRNCDHGLSVAWQPITLAVAQLDNNPNVGGGKRFFPDQLAASDSTPRHLVQVEAKVTPPAEDLTIYFHSFDIDDPSSNSAPIDPNGPQGQDNRTVFQNGRPEGKLDAVAVQTDASGTARATLNLSAVMQPGNNFRVAASTRRGSVDSTMQAEADAGNGSEDVELTEPLTVWRRLHVELDTMVAPTGDQNTVRGQIIDSREATGPAGDPACVLETNRQLEEDNQYAKDEWNPPGHGDLTVAGRNYAVLTNQMGQNARLATSRVLGGCPTVGAEFTLHDDDEDDQSLPELPDDRYFRDSDSPLVNRLAPAYIRPVVLSGSHDPRDGAAFDRNADLIELKNPLYGGYAQRDTRDQSADSYWVSYLLKAFQGPVSEDADPDETNAGRGLTPASVGTEHNVSVLFGEVIADSCNRRDPLLSEAEATVAIHELGHQLIGGDFHGDGGIMTPGVCASPPEGFTPISIARMRFLVAPGLSGFNALPGG